MRRLRKSLDLSRDYPDMETILFASEYIDKITFEYNSLVLKIVGEKDFRQAIAMECNGKKCTD